MLWSVWAEVKELAMYWPKNNPELNFLIYGEFPDIG